MPAIKSRKVLLVVIAFVLLAIIGTSKNSLYSFCLARDICAMPSLAGFDIRMKSKWLPTIQELGDEKILAFEKDGKARADGGVAIKFIHDEKSAKLLSLKLKRKSYAWGVGYEGASSMLPDLVAPAGVAYYLVVPELGLLITCDSSDAFDEIVRLTKLGERN